MLKNACTAKRIALGYKFSWANLEFNMHIHVYIGSSGISAVRTNASNKLHTKKGK